MATIENVKTELGDSSIEFPILSDAEYAYFLNKNNNSLGRTCIDCARAILMKLSMRSDQTIDLFSIKSSKTAAQYMSALKLYISNPSLNPLNQNTSIYFGGVSKSDMQANIDNVDNNVIIKPSSSNCSLPTNFFG
jgi:hypothetical protein